MQESKVNPGDRLSLARDVQRGDLVVFDPADELERSQVWEDRKGVEALVLGSTSDHHVCVQDPTSERLWDFFTAQPESFRLVARAAYNEKQA